MPPAWGAVTWCAAECVAAQDEARADGVYSDLAACVRSLLAPATGA